MKQFLGLVALVGLLLGACASPASQVGQIRVEGAWGRPATAGGNGGVYFVLRNTGAADKLVSVSSDVAKAAEIHQTMTEGGVARMAPVTAIEVPANGSVELKPGGYHIMLIGLNRELRAGESFPLTLKFASGASGVVTVTVKGNDSGGM
ncbi:MAG: copper chaperone PCu(A)C [Dehalococcoidia bacterium]